MNDATPGLRPDLPARHSTLLAAPDSFKGTASARQVADAIEAGARAVGRSCGRCPLSDGGDGFGEVLGGLGGELRTVTVTGPGGAPVPATWRSVGDLAVVESAQASGLILAGGAEGNDPVAATSRGTGELIAAALAGGARRVLVGLGGSATTDGGQGAVAALEAAGGFGDADVEVACDTTTRFRDAAAVFGPQKGASPAQVTLLTSRLDDLARSYATRYGINVGSVPGSGAAGGLAGGLAALGARLRPGFEVVAGAVGLEERARGAGMLITGEGRLDATSWTGKVVGGVAELARRLGVPLLIVAGSVADDAGTVPGTTAPGTKAPGTTVPGTTVPGRCRGRRC